MPNPGYQVTVSLAACVFLASTGASAARRSHFLSHGPSVAAYGRGETGTTFLDGLSSLFYNPSLGAPLKNGALDLAYHQLAGQSKYHFVSAGFPSGANFFSMYLVNLQSGETELRQRIDDVPLAVRTNHWAAGITVARHLDGFYGIDIGAGIKYVYLDLSRAGGGGGGLDLGIARHFTGPEMGGKRSLVTVGVSALNILPPRLTLISGEEALGASYRAGVSLSYPVLYRFLSYDTLSVFGDIGSEESRLTWHSGLEYVFLGNYFLRAGYYPDTVTTGLGYRFDRLGADYAVAFNDLATFHRLGFSYYWKGTGTRKAPVAPGVHLTGSPTSLMREAQKTLHEIQRTRRALDREMRPLFMSGVREYRMKRYLSAADIFQDIIVRYPGHTMANVYHEKIAGEMTAVTHNHHELDFEKAAYARGFVSYREQRFEEAINEWEKVLKVNPARTELTTYVTQVKAYLQDIARRKKEEETESRVVRLFDEASAYFSSNDWVRCIKILEKIRGICRQEPFPSSFDWLKRTDESIRKAVDELAGSTPEPEAPKSGETQEEEIDRAGADKKYNEGLVLYAQGKNADAMRAWEIALRLDPYHEKAEKALERTKNERETKNPAKKRRRKRGKRGE